MFSSAEHSTLGEGRAEQRPQAGARRGTWQMPLEGCTTGAIRGIFRNKYFVIRGPIAVFFVTKYFVIRVPIAVFFVTKYFAIVQFETQNLDLNSSQNIFQY